MYLSYYNLKKKPFQITTDPEILWWGDKYKTAYALLKKGVSESKELIVLTGDIGLGKTTLINALISSLDEKTMVARFPAPELKSIDFYKIIASSFHLNQDFRDEDEFRSSLADFFNAAREYSHKLLLIMDQAHLGNYILFEEIYYLLSLEENQDKAFTVILVGQNELKCSLSAEENSMLGTRVTDSYQIDPLTRNETDNYIQHCLKLAGSEKRIFSFDAIEEIHAFSEGNPHLINILCDLALATGYVADIGTINSGVVIDSAEKLQLRRQAKEDEIENRKILHRERPNISAVNMKKIFNRLVFYLALPLGVLIIGGYFYFSSPPIPAEKYVYPVIEILKGSVETEKEITAIHPDKSLKASIIQNRLTPDSNLNIDEALKTEALPDFKKTPTLQDKKYVDPPISIPSATQQPPRSDIQASAPNKDKDITIDEAPQDLPEETEIERIKKPATILPKEVSIHREGSEQSDETESPAEEVSVQQEKSEQKNEIELPLKTEDITQKDLIEPSNSGEMGNHIDYEVIANHIDQNIIPNTTDERDEKSEAEVSASGKQSSDTAAEEPDPTNVIDWLIKKRSQ